MNARRLFAIGLVASFAAACGSSATPSPAPGSPGASTVAASAGATVAGASATTYPTPSSDTIAIAPTPSDSASAAVGASTGPAATRAPRVAWATGQTVKQYVLTGPGTGWVLTNRSLWQTVDDGVSWASAYPHGLIATTIRGLGAFDANHALLAAVDVGHSTSTYYVWHTANGGLTWAYTALPPIAHDILASPCAPGDFCGAPGDPAATFDYVDANTAFVYIWMRSGFDGLSTSIFETTNGGVTWTPRTYTPADPGLGSGDAYRVQFMTPNIGVAEYFDQISSTITGWGHWTNRHLPTTDYSEPTIYFLSATKWYGDLGLDFGTASVTYNYTDSTDQGHTWTNYSSEVPGIASLASAQVQFLGPLQWIGTEQTYGTGGLGQSQTIYTTDGGHHWALMGPQPFNGSQAYFVDATHGWAGPSEQVPSARLYTSSDGGLHWRLITP
jgi:hypothetical protein